MYIRTKNRIYKVESILRDNGFVKGYNVAGKHLAILRDGKKEYYFLEYDKQFFNDLRLERVEE